MKRQMFLIYCLLLHFGYAYTQPKARPDLKLIFYNVENFFDWKNDPAVNDEEFLPEGSRKWTKYRFEAKANNIYKVLAAAGELEFPDIIGMAEIENTFVIDYLCNQTPMKKIPLGYIHRESPDPRGIDACILYRKDKLKLLRSEFIKIVQKNGQPQGTRDIVYASFRVKGKDDLHVFVNHWPSRRGGELASQQKRNMVASLLRLKVDSILKTDASAKIVITGDFNDEPYNHSLTKFLRTQSVEKGTASTGLYNLSASFIKQNKTGTLKYRGTWSVFDQIVVSGSLLGKKGLATCTDCAGVFNPRFLLTDDKTHMGFMPWRTFNGPTYAGGFSDHLPVFLNLYLFAS